MIVILPATPVNVEVFYGWQLRLGDALCSSDHPLDGLAVLLRAAPVSGHGVPSQDTLNGAPVEVVQDPGIHAELFQSAEEELVPGKGKCSFYFC